ncbi:hypothetical protein QOT17_001362 [Balamuthia mandrillaris]
MGQSVTKQLSKPTDCACKNASQEFVRTLILCHPQHKWKNLSGQAKDFARFLGSGQVTMGQIGAHAPRIVVRGALTGIAFYALGKGTVLDTALVLGEDPELDQIP